MDGPVKPMQWWFHSDVKQVHLLFEPLILSNTPRLIGGYLLVITICWSERAISYYLDYADYRSARRIGRHILLRTGLYCIATILRLWYMLVTMYFNTGLFIVVVSALTSAQLIIEYYKASARSSDENKRGNYRNWSQTYKVPREEEEHQLFAVPHEDDDSLHDVHPSRS
ncbi:hypothetical protein EC973_004391 [Apophysomyces ossiformis]|uniref:Copper transporter n=1 Tax=Apophysomyces ossiformis TaxID=679940 RepID=A0A8H7ERW5_9FUNG|nr:hypothetical protein EC973_004391 [Apophysomyces ossiformis]